MPTPNRHPQRGNVLVLTMFALIPLLGFLGLAVDLGYMFNYKLRAQIAVDAAALAAALEPYTAGDLSKNTDAALDIAKHNGFGDVDPNDPANGCDAPNSKQICIAVRTPPLEGAFVGSAGGEAYEVDLRQNLPTYFMSAVGVTSFPIHVRAVAKSKPAVLPCFTVGNTTIQPGSNVEGNCELFFTDTISGGCDGCIKANATNLDTAIYNVFKNTAYDKNMVKPPPPGEVFPKFDASIDPNCGTDIVCRNATITQRCYRDITVDKNCKFGPGEYKITRKVTFEPAAEATGINMIFLLKAGSSIWFNNKLNLSGSVPDYPNTIIWAEEDVTGTTSINFDKNVKPLDRNLPLINGHIYAPSAQFNLAGHYSLSPGSGLASKPGLVE